MEDKKGEKNIFCLEGERTDRVSQSVGFEKKFLHRKNNLKIYSKK
jgi:hypothetical protein